MGEELFNEDGLYRNYSMIEPQKKQPFTDIHRLVVGLGNPGTEYTGTRHNLGWAALDAFLKLLDVKKDFSAYRRSRIQIVTVDDMKVLLVRPSTFMNLSGNAVAPILETTGLETKDLLVVHDEMDIPTGRAKIYIGGRAAGHRGVGDIIEKCGEDFARLKIGIGTPPDESEDAGIDWVLSEISEEEKEIYENMMPKIAHGIRLWILEGPGKAMTWFNTSMKPDGEEITNEVEAEKDEPDSDVTQKGSRDE